MTASKRAIAHIHAAAKEASIGDTSQAIHDRLHGWAVNAGYNSLTDMPDHDLDAMAWEIKSNPEVMAAWFDQFEPPEWERMADAENVEPGDPSVLRHLFTPEQLADLNADADRNLERVAERYRQ